MTAMTHRAGDRRAVLIAGPTASGKSALALSVAERVGGVVINADSMQVYRDLAILTARPTQADEARIAHRLYGHVDGAERYSVGAWLKAARAAAKETWSQGRIAVFVGGTGLYFRALEEGLAAVPAIPAAVREAVRARLARQGPQRLHGVLAARAPEEAARIRPGDRQRIARALEVLEATGRPLGSFHGGDAQGVLDDCRITRAIVMPERQELYRRIDQRFGRMVEAGALGEVEALMARRLDADLPVMKAIGVAALSAHVAGQLTLEEAMDTASRQSRNYAKRQMTWARRQMARWPVFDAPEAALEGILAAPA